MREITVQELEQSLRSEKSYALINVSPAESHAAGHIPGAMNVPLSEFPSFLQHLPEVEKIYIHCRSGRQSQLACQLVDMLHGDSLAYNVLGGFMAWQEAGFPIEQGNVAK